MRDNRLCTTQNGDDRFPVRVMNVVSSASRALPHSPDCRHIRRVAPLGIAANVAKLPGLLAAARTGTADRYYR